LTQAAPELSASPIRDTISRLAQGLRELRKDDGLGVLLYTSRPEYFDQSDLVDRRRGIVKYVHFAASEAELNLLTERFDIALVCTNIKQEHKAQYIIRRQNLAALIVVWSWDCHHHHEENLRFSSLADVIIPAHSSCNSRLKTPHSVLGRPFPLATAQWSRCLASKLLARDDVVLRSDALSGGYVLWALGHRNEILRALKTGIPGNALRLMEPNDRDPYFKLSAEERFQDWAKFKVSIAVPISDDLPLRVFDALIAGQIPIVPTSCKDLDSAIPTDVQSKLPVIRVEDLSPQTVEAGWRIALKSFDEMGMQGIIKRHEYARDHHHISCRIADISEYIKGLEREQISLAVDDWSVGLVAGRLQPELPPACASELRLSERNHVYTEDAWIGAETIVIGSTSRIRTASAPWSYAAQARLEGFDIFDWYWVKVCVEVHSGQVGVGILTADGLPRGEQLLTPQLGWLRLSFKFLRTDIALLIRNGALGGSSVVDITELRIYGAAHPGVGEGPAGWIG
jgi:hypothetical protein